MGEKDLGTPLAGVLRAAIIRWDNREIIPGAEGTSPGPGVQLAHYELAFADLRGRNLTSANLATADLTNANLTSSTLTNANFARTKLTNVSFNGYDL